MDEKMNGQRTSDLERRMQSHGSPTRAQGLPGWSSTQAEHRARAGPVMSAAIARKPPSCAVWLCTGVLASMLGSTSVLAACGRPRIVLDGSQEEHGTACRALEEVLQYFEQGGLAIDPELTIQFRREVYVEVVNPATNETRLVRVSGVYRAGTKELQMTSSHSPWIVHRRPWGLAWDEDLARSILQHEIVHAVMAQLMGGNYAKLPRSWHEALAYAVQIDLMPPDLKTRVLEPHRSEEGFVNTLEVNDTTYGLNPDAFAVAAYKLYVRNGRLDFLKRVIALQLDIFRMNDIVQ